MFDNLFGIKEDWVVFFDMFSKNGNGDSTRPLAEELKKRRPDMKFFFCCNKKNMLSHIDMADEILVEKTLRFKYVCSRAKYIISPMGFPNKGKKRKGQVFVQTWHGNALKKTYLARDKNNHKFKKYAKQFENTDLFLLQGDKTRECMKEVFDLKDSMLFESGFPRNDILFNATEEFKNDLRKQLGLPEGKKVIFYCPTWRSGNYKAYLPFNLKKFKEVLGKDYVMLIRSHVGKHKWVDANGNLINIFDNEFSFDGGWYPEATHLYLISDIFISDYSSAIYDFAVTKKPEILYIYDADEYTKEFGLFFDIRHFTPFPKAENEQELLDAILNLNINQEEYDKFLKDYCTYEDGHASEKVIDAMIKIGDGRK